MGYISIFGIYEIWCCISISGFDVRYVPNIVLKVYLRTRYSVSTEYSAVFRSQSSIFSTQSSIFGIYRIRYCISILKLNIRYIDGTQSNLELNFDLRARYSVHR